MLVFIIDLLQSHDISFECSLKGTKDFALGFSLGTKIRAYGFKKVGVVPIMTLKLIRSRFANC